MGLALSVQVIDEKHAWLVALNSHEREARFRDMYINNVDGAVALNRYFMRLWDLSTVVLRNGQVTDAGQTFSANPTKAKP
jgi:hypothetical protein